MSLMSSKIYLSIHCNNQMGKFMEEKFNVVLKIKLFTKVNFIKKKSFWKKNTFLKFHTKLPK